MFFNSSARDSPNILNSKPVCQAVKQAPGIAPSVRFCDMDLLSSKYPGPQTMEAAGFVSQGNADVSLPGCRVFVGFGKIK